QKCAKESGLQEERENPLHRKRLSDHAARGLRERRPVCAELELHWNARDHAEDEIDSEDAAPKARGFIVVPISSANRERLENHDQQREAHRQLRKQVMKGGRECEMDTVNR